ncbi:MAG: SDR family oxidoreductase [Gammaproteobacteria bacterium]|nr:SDR family oxidoreductase [Gammaproteobacteria bacterium]
MRNSKPLLNTYWKKVVNGVLIFGATQGTGLEVARLLAARGDSVTAAVRASSDTGQLEAIGVKTIIADVFDPEAVAAALRSKPFKTILLSLSGTKGETRRADREGVNIIIDAARQVGIKRVLMVTAIGCGDSHGAVAPKVIEILGEVLAAKTEAENNLEQSGLDYTILRPGGLTDNPASGTAIKSTDHQLMGVANRADVAKLVVDCIDDASTIGEIYHAIDPEITWQAPLQRGEDISKGK